MGDRTSGGFSMIGFVIQMMVFTLMINLGLTFGPPLLVIYFTFGWAQRQNWSEYPNFNGMLLSAGIIAGWILLCVILGQNENQNEWGMMAMFTYRGNSWNPFWLGALRVGIYSLYLIGAGIVIAIVVGIIKWLFQPRC